LRDPGPSSQPVPATPRQSPGREYRWVVLAVAFFGVFGALGFGRFGYSAVLPSMQKALQISSAAAGSLASWNLAGYTVMAAVGGILASKLGQRKVITAGITITGVGMLVTGLSHELGVASFGRLITGVGNGMVLVPSVTLMAAWFDAQRLGFASSIVSAGSSPALVVVGLAVPRLISAGGAEGWRLAWYLFAGVTFLMAIFSAVFQRDRPAGSRSGSGEIVLDKSAPANLRARLPKPSLELKRIVRSGYAWHLGLIYACYGVGLLIYFTFFQKRLTADLGYSAQTAGYLFLMLGVAGLFGGALWGSASDRIGRKVAITLMLTFAGVGSLLFGLHPNLAMLAVSSVLFGASGPAVPGLVGVACSEKFGYRLASASLGFVTILVGLGQTIGPYIGGLMSDAFGSLGPTYLFSAALFFAGAAAALVLGEGGLDTGERVQMLPPLPERRVVK
jgi:predicted MFS family arabinose efflux permease